MHNVCVFKTFGVFTLTYNTHLKLMFNLYIYLLIYTFTLGFHLDNPYRKKKSDFFIIFQTNILYLKIFFYKNIFWHKNKF